MFRKANSYASVTSTLFMAVLVLLFQTAPLHADVSVTSGTEPWVALVSLQTNSTQEMNNKAEVSNGDDYFVVKAIDTKTGEADFEYIWAQVSGKIVKQTVFYKMLGKAILNVDMLSVELSNDIMSYRSGTNSGKSILTYNQWTKAEGIIGKTKLLKQTKEELEKRISDVMNSEDYNSTKESVLGSYVTWQLAVRNMSNELQVNRFFEKNSIVGRTVSVPCVVHAVEKSIIKNYLIHVTANNSFGGIVNFYTNDESYIDNGEGDEIIIKGELTSYNVTGFSSGSTSLGGDDIHILSYSIKGE